MYGAFWCVGKIKIMKDFLIFLVPFGVLERMKLWAMSWYVLGFLVCWKGSNYERFLDISGALWCAEKGRIMSDFLIFLVSSGVLKIVELWAIYGACCGVLKRVNLSKISSYSAACWCVGKKKIISDFLIFLVPFGKLERIELWAISWNVWCLLVYWKR